MSLSLLKSAKYPDTEADMGEQEFTYALLPHKGALGSRTIDEAILLNPPSKVVKGRTAEKLPTLIQKIGDGVKVDAVKPAEDGDGLIVRMHECLGGREKAVLTSAYGIKAYAECNLLEECEEKTEGAEIQATFRPFQIRCFRIWL